MHATYTIVTEKWRQCVVQEKNDCPPYIYVCIINHHKGMEGNDLLAMLPFNHYTVYYHEQHVNHISPKKKG